MAELRPASNAIAITVRGVVQGVGFRPFVHRLARRSELAGWVLNAGDGVEIHLEGAEPRLRAFVCALAAEQPEAAVITEIRVSAVAPEGLAGFEIRRSEPSQAPTTRVAADLPVCGDCLRELRDPADRRYRYPYINCTNCGPRYSVITALPYDRPNTTMAAWPLDAACAAEYGDPDDRRFHAEPVACPRCGPQFSLRHGDRTIAGTDDAIRHAARLLADGAIVAVKGIGGYHLACDARRDDVVAQLRSRKFRKEKPFALMARDLAVARQVADLTPETERLLTSRARPIVLAPARDPWPVVAPDTTELGVMLPYTPLHHLLFASGAPDLLVMTSGNRASEPIAYRDEDALDRLAGLADAMLVGERPIARRVDDSIVRSGPTGPVVLRRARGYAPDVVAAVPTTRPMLALGGDLKNTITLVVAGQAMVSQHIGDLDYLEARLAFRATVDDLIAMYRVTWEDVRLVHDAHPQYVSTAAAAELPAGPRVAVQHHRAHVASVLAERQEWDRRVVGLSLDGTGYGDDGTIWGGEIFVGSVAGGFSRAGHLRAVRLPGGDHAARQPVHCAAGFLDELEGLGVLPDLTGAPFHLGARYRQARQALQGDIGVFRTTSMGRLFDAVAALLGFTREVSFEGQAAMWVEHLAAEAGESGAYPLPWQDGALDVRPLLEGVVRDRGRGRDPRRIARAVHASIARGLVRAAAELCEAHGLETVVGSGGVLQNRLLLAMIDAGLTRRHLTFWTNHLVPPNDGGLSLGQVALAAFDEAAPEAGTPSLASPA